LSDYGKGSLRHCSHLIKAATDKKIPVVVDPKGSDFGRYIGATIITPNKQEFETVVGPCYSDSDIEEKGVNLRDSLNLQALLITRGEQGMSLLACGEPPLHLTAHAKQVFDVTGAGDTVAAVLGLAIGAGLALDDSVRLANLAAGIVVSKLGTSTVTRQELKRQLVPSYSTSNNVIYDRGELSEFMRLSREQGNRIVMTNGCFDLIHPGHVHYLEAARSLGDILIVAVNDDDSVRRLKGPQRPVNSLQYRMRMLSALGCVDCVVPFAEDTPYSLYANFLPDVLVKGGDYHVDSVVGGNCVRAAGGNVVILDYLPGYSSTGLISRINELCV